MPEGLHGVICSFSDCMYYVKLPEQPSRAFCRHPEVQTNLPSTICPFYRVDWQDKAEELSKRFKKR